MTVLRLCVWNELSKAQQAQVAALQVSEQQSEFAGPIARSIEWCETQEPDFLQGIALLVADAAIGFLIVKRGAAAPAWVPADSVIVNALRIDTAHQGRGWGAQALAALPSFVLRLWPASRQLVLTVDEPNSVARAAYGKAGWVDEGIRITGRIGVECRMHYTLK